MAVAKALGARRILAIDVQPHRLEFAENYAATEVHVASPKLPGEDKTAYSKRHVSDQSYSSRLPHRSVRTNTDTYDRLKRSWPSLALASMVRE